MLDGFNVVATTPPTLPKAWRVRWVLVSPLVFVRDSLASYLQHYASFNGLPTETIEPHQAVDCHDALTPDVCQSLDAPESNEHITLLLIDAAWLSDTLTRQPALADWLMAWKHRSTQGDTDRLPRRQLALTTCQPMEHTVALMRRLGVSHQLGVGIPFHVEEWAHWLQSMLDGAMGKTASSMRSHDELRRYLSPDATVSHMTLTSSHDIQEAFMTLLAFFEAAGLPTGSDLPTAVIEALTNAVYHAIPNADGSGDKYEKGQIIDPLQPDEYVTLSYGYDDDWLGLSITDQGGRLQLDDVLYWMERNMTGENLFDTSGRGLFLMHSLCDRFYIRVTPHRATELLLLKHLEREQSDLLRVSPRPVPALSPFTSHHPLRQTVKPFIYNTL
jgi:anti-sigma regulatory factor (Ser/Thr protein kinase)